MCTIAQCNKGVKKMGFDLDGLKPVNETGAYFRNNVWSWPQLWAFVCHCCDDILSPEQVEGGYANVGIKIESWQAQLIAERLKDFIVKNTIPEIQREVVIPDKVKKSTIALAELFGGIGAIGAIRNIEDNLCAFVEFASSSGGFCIY